MTLVVDGAPKVLLCLDSNRKNGAEILGLGSRECSAPWIRKVFSAAQARGVLAELSGISEVWVAGSGNMDPLNLAAGLQRQCGEVRVFLLSGESTGSFLSRCAAAGVVPCVGKVAVLNLYRRACSMYGHAKGPGDDELPLAACMSGTSLSQRKVLPSLEDSSSSKGAVRPPVRKEPLPTVAASPQQSGSMSVEDASKDSCRPLVLPKPLQAGGFVLSIVSGSGGSGKSSVSVLAGVLSQSMGARTVVLDADFQFGDVAWLMGRKDSIDALSLLRHGTMASSLSPDGDIPAVIHPPAGLECSEEVFGNVAELIRLAREAFDVVIVNTGSFWIDAHLDLIEESNHVLFLCDQRPSSLRGCSRAIELCVRCGVPTQRFSYALNRCGKQGLLSAVDASCALKGAKVRELREGGKEVSELLGAGLPLELACSKNPFVRDVSKLVDEILPVERKVEDSVMEARNRRNRKGLSLVRRGRAA